MGSGRIPTGSGRATGTGSTEAGFSLVEALVTLAVLTFIVGIGYPALADWLETYQVRTAAQELATNVQLQRMRAVSRNTDFSIDFDDATNTYGLFEGDPATGTMLDPAARSLPQGVTFSASGGGDAVDAPNDELIFHPDGSVNDRLVQDDTIHLTGSNDETFRVIVNRATGRVSVEH